MGEAVSVGGDRERGGIVLPSSYDTFHYKDSDTPLWDRIRNRCRIIFSTDRTPHEMVLIFEALQDANLRLEELEKAYKELRDHRHTVYGAGAYTSGPRH